MRVEQYKELRYGLDNQEEIKMAGYPMTGYQGNWGTGFESQTMKGVRGMTNALLIFIVVGVLSIVVGYVAVAVLGSLFTPGGGLTSGALASAAGALALACGLMLLSLAGLIIALIALWSMHKGRAEFGPAHEKDIGKSVMLLVLAIVVYFAGIVANAVIVFSSIDFTNPSEVKYVPSVATEVVTGATGIASALVIALLLYYLVKSFIPPEKVNMAILAIGLYVVSPVVTMIGALTLAPPTDYYLHPGTVAFNYLWLVPSLIAGIIGFFAVLLFYMLYRYVLSRLRDRTIKPVWETAAASPGIQVHELRWQPPPQP